MEQSSAFDKFVVDEQALLLTNDHKVPLIYWPVAPNFGDELSRWLVEKMTGRQVAQSKGATPAYVAIGSIINRVRDGSQVWGTGSFGPEKAHEINVNAHYHAVRGPLTRARILNHGGRCPRIYGDPALLTPLFFSQPLVKDAEIGLAVRWSDKNWKSLDLGPGIKLIDLGSADVEGVLQQLLSCKKIITSSLHGLIIADAYKIPSAWLSSDSPKGREFKFYDYFISVDKVRNAHEVDLKASGWDLEALNQIFTFDGRNISFSAETLLDACPFLKRQYPDDLTG